MSQNEHRRRRISRSDVRHTLIEIGHVLIEAIDMA